MLILQLLQFECSCCLISAVQVDVVCTSRIPEFFLITLMTPTEGILNELTIQHEPGQVATDFNVSLPQSVDVCTIHARISAGNSAGMSAPSEPVGKVLTDNYITKTRSKTVKNSQKQSKTVCS